ncbi:MAG: metallophosphoesterase family protein [Phycisphaerae bacterium]
MRILIVSDVHANPWALMAVAKDAGAFDHVLCAGGSVNYGSRPAEAIAWLWAHGAVAVRGNHDDAVAYNHHPRATAKKAALAMPLRDWTQTRLQLAHLHWLGRLPLMLTWECGGARFVMTHATPTDTLYDYSLQPGASDELFEQKLHAIDTDFIVLGHTHLPYVRKLNHSVVVNPGSVGQPLDGDSRASYAVWDDGQIFLYRVEYDLQLLIRTLDEPPLSPDLYQRLCNSFEKACMD